MPLDIYDPLDFLESENELQKRRENRSPEVDHNSYKRRVNWYKEGDVTTFDLHILYAIANGLCFYCDTFVANPRFIPTDIRGFDHIIPREKGGQHTITNLVVCCKHCNEVKGGNRMHPSQELLGD